MKLIRKIKKWTQTFFDIAWVVLKLNKEIIICNYPKYLVVEYMANQQTGGQNSITKYRKILKISPSMYKPP